MLIVDDDCFLRVVIQEALQETGYQVETAADGEIAWQKIDQEPDRFDLMILDKCMPNLGGIDLIKRIKQDGRFKDLPIVMLTGSAKQQDIQEGLAAGAHYYLTKPTPDGILKTVIRNALNELQQKRELLSLVGQQAANMEILRRAEFSFQNLKQAKNLALWLADLSGTPERTVNAYSELLINAVEHGNLGISYKEKGQLIKNGHWADEIATRLQRTPFCQRRVKVMMEKIGADCVVTIQDQGHGFNWSNYLDFSPERAFDLHGRGIAMSRLLGFDSMEYLGNGNTVVTVVKMPAM